MASQLEQGQGMQHKRTQHRGYKTSTVSLWRTTKQTFLQTPFTPCSLPRTVRPKQQEPNITSATNNKNQTPPPTFPQNAASAFPLLAVCSDSALPSPLGPGSTRYSALLARPVLHAQGLHQTFDAQHRLPLGLQGLLRLLVWCGRPAWGGYGPTAPCSG